jgi:hypothetical protein
MGTQVSLAPETVTEYLNADEAELAESSATALEDWPLCRYLGDPLHSCTRNTGEPLRPGETCWAEAAAQLREDVL